MAATDRFVIHPALRVYLVLQLAFPLLLIGMLVWAVSTPGLELDPVLGPIGIAVFAGWALWDLYKLVRWSSFSVEIGDEQLRVGKTSVAWSDIRRASVRPAIKFATHVELETTGGETLRIPAGIQKNALVVTLIEKHYPDLRREG